MKKILLISLASTFVLFILFCGTMAYRAQRADYGWNPTLDVPVYAATHPRVVVDQAHNNASTAGWANRYWPFARLLRKDGYEVVKGTDAYSAGILAALTF